MITVEISNIWGSVSLPDLLGLEAEIAAAHAALTDPDDPHKALSGWTELPFQISLEEELRIQEAAERIRGENDVLVVISADDGALGAQAVIELLQGTHRNLTRKLGDPQIFFTGNDLSAQGYQELTCLLEGKDFSLCLIQPSDSTPECGILFRNLRWLLERRYGTDESRRRIYAILGDVPLTKTAREEDWEMFSIPAYSYGGFHALGCAGLLPMAVAGIDIAHVLKGARDAAEQLQRRSFENPAWLYAAVRNLMDRRGMHTEVIASFAPGFSTLGQWWQRLFARAGGKSGHGIFPVAVTYPDGLPGFGQRIQQGRRDLFETVLRFPAEKTATSIVSDVKDTDGLNYLTNRPTSFVTSCACNAVISAHADGGIPVICIDCGENSPQGLGALLYFLQLSSALSALAMEVDPNSREGLAPYQEELYRLLGKPEDGRI